jgi:hypothetical protein
MKTVEEIIGMFGGVDGLYVSITNEPYMGLVIEHVGTGLTASPRSELRQFAATWDHNLREQGFLEAARRLHSDALRTKRRNA